MHIPQVLLLLGGAALFLFGMTLMGDGLQKASGSKLEPILYKLSGTTLRGILLGTGVTAVIQSSCATSVMAVGFVNSGMMKVRQAIGVILGAILGTSVTGWVICLSYIEGGSGLGAILSTRNITAVIAVAGVILRLFCKGDGQKHVGDVLMGFAVLMLGMSTMSDAASFLGEQPWFTAAMTSMTMPLLGILVGTVFTALLQSASAALGIIQALSVTGAMTFASAMPLLMGVTIGASLPVLLSAVGARVEGKRTAMVYLASSIIGTAVLAVIFYAINLAFPFAFLEKTANPFSLAAANSVYRFLVMLILAPFADALERLVEKLVPGEQTEQDPSLALEERFLEHPALAIEQSSIAIKAMAASTQSAVIKATDLLLDYSEEGLREVLELEKKCDQYEDNISAYLVKLTARELTELQNREISILLHVLTDFERISDHARNIAESARELLEKGLSFSEDAKQDLAVGIEAAIEVLRMAVEAFETSDLALAKRVEPLETVIDNLCLIIKHHHIERLHKGLCTIPLGFVLNDLVTDIERISDHASNIALVVFGLEDESFEPHEYINMIQRGEVEGFEDAVQEFYTRYYLE